MYGILYLPTCGTAILWAWASWRHVYMTHVYLFLSLSLYIYIYINQYRYTYTYTHVYAYIFINELRREKMYASVFVHMLNVSRVQFFVCTMFAWHETT